MTELELLGKRMGPDYNCCHFACEAWAARTGKDALSPVLADFLAPRGVRTARPAIRHAFERLPAPVSPCVVVMHRTSSDSHVGIYESDMILHLTRAGAKRQPRHLAILGYRTVRYYAVRSADYGSV